ncbi:uncharacterized protein LOC114306142 [Camellia sinensis]|uniref:uncharacterized protein LOC114306142 n=1 Tax=Camellia sinensis TaxID=4442 RepID=UPI001035EA44|nr:uncharacterized protein LOC114306142 [Camellia sinensis]
MKASIYREENNVIDLYIILLRFSRYVKENVAGFLSNCLLCKKVCMCMLNYLPLPNKETLSRHSFLGPNGLWGEWLGPSPETKVHYLSNTDLTPNENSRRLHNMTFRK